jgi:hypothetical protein
VLLSAAVGVPLITPLEPLRERPAGRVPLVMDQVNGDVPPLAASVALYATLTCPFGRELVVIVIVAGAIVSVRFAVFVCIGFPASCTWKVSAVPVAAAVGVPVIAPVDAFKLKPVGSVPLVIDQEKGFVPPLAANVVVYATPTWPLGSELVVIARAAGTIVIDKVCGAF